MSTLIVSWPFSQLPSESYHTFMSSLNLANISTDVSKSGPAQAASVVKKGWSEWILGFTQRLVFIAAPV